MAKTKIYQNFQDKIQNNYFFNNYLDFATWFFNLSFQTKNDRFESKVLKKLQRAAQNSKEARTIPARFLAN